MWSVFVVARSLFVGLTISSAARFFRAWCMASQQGVLSTALGGCEGKQGDRGLALTTSPRTALGPHAAGVVATLSLSMPAPCLPLPFAMCVWSSVALTFVRMARCLARRFLWGRAASASSLVAFPAGSALGWRSRSAASPPAVRQCTVFFLGGCCRCCCCC